MKKKLTNCSVWQNMRLSTPAEPDVGILEHGLGVSSQSMASSSHSGSVDPNAEACGGGGG